MQLLIATLALMVQMQAPDATQAPPAMDNAPPARWEDGHDVAGMVGGGTVELCEVLALPVNLIPQVGGAAAMALEWACLIPGAVGSDMVERQHGTRRGWVWQGTLALAAAKAWRDGTRLLVGGAIAITAVGLVATMVVLTGALAVTFWPAAPFFLPVLVAGVVAMATFGYVVIREVRKAVQEKIFQLIYGLITPDYTSAEEQQASQQHALLHPPFNIAERWWYLAALSGGSEPPSSWTHLLPVAGPLFKARDAATAKKELLRRAATEDLKEQSPRWPAVDATVNILSGSEGVLGALAHLAIMSSVGLVLAGSVAALAQIPLGKTQPQFTRDYFLNDWKNVMVRSAPLALLTGFLGVMALGNVGGAVLFVVAREVPKALEPLIIPVVFGLLPAGPWFPAREADKPVAPPAQDRTLENKKLDDAVDGWLATPPVEEPAPAPAPAPEPAPLVPEPPPPEPLPDGVPPGA